MLPKTTGTTGAAATAALSKHRIEALSDGVYAIAMTLLVLELKIPEALHSDPSLQLAQALGQLIPKLVSWALSFFILAIFWVAHHRLFHYVQTVDTKLLWINVVSLLFVSMMPFSSALTGEFGGEFIAQVIYAANMTALALVSIWQYRHLDQHRELTHNGFSLDVVNAGRFRCWSLVVTALLAVAIAWFFPRIATMAFALMPLLSRVSRRFHTRPTAAT